MIIDVAPRFDTSCKSRLKGEENTRFSILCCVHGYPPPNVVIYDSQGKIVVNQTDRAVWTDTLTYRNRRSQYMCVAQNHVGQISQKFTLETLCKLV